MPVVLLRVPRLLQRAQHQVAQDPLFRLARDLRRQPAVHLRRHRQLLRHLMRSPVRTPPTPVAPSSMLPLPLLVLHGKLLDRQVPNPQRIPKSSRNVLEVQNALRIRLLVDPVQRRRMLAQPARHRLVCRQHELFNQPVRPVPGSPRHPRHRALLVKLDRRLRQIEVNRPPPHPLFIQNLRQPLHRLEVRHQLCVLHPCRRISFQHRRDCRVGHAPRRPNHPFADLIPCDLAAPVDPHPARQHQPILIRPQRANVARQLLRQHRDRPVRKIHARPPQPRFQVQRGPRPHILGHVRDVHVQLPLPAGKLAHLHRIVEIPRRFAVDCHNRSIAKVPTRFDPLLDNLRVQVRHRPRFGQHPLRKHPRQLVLADHHLHIHAKVVLPPQHLHHAPPRHTCRGRPLRYLDIHHQPFQVRVLGNLQCCLFPQHPVRRPQRRPRFRQRLVKRNQNRLRDLFVKSRHLVPRLPRLRVVKDPHNGRVAPRQHPHHPALPPVCVFLSTETTPARRNLHQHLVALHRAIDLRRRDKHVGRLR